MSFTVIVLGFFVAFMFGPREVNAASIINQVGTFPSKDSLMMLHVARESGTLVVFQLTRAADGHILFSENIGSDAMRWCFYWDEENRLWAYSSDSGYFASFTLKPDGTVVKSDVVVDGPRPKCPQPIYDFLPSSLKRGWEGTAVK